MQQMKHEVMEPLAKDVSKQVHGFYDGRVEGEMKQIASHETKQAIDHCQGILRWNGTDVDRNAAGTVYVQWSSVGVSPNFSAFSMAA